MWWNRYIDFKFEDRGRGETSGDCWGLVREVYKNELGIELPSYDQNYIDTCDKNTVNATIEFERKNWISVDEPKPFDVIILNMRGLPMHIGIVTKPDLMLHCAKGINTSHERYNGVRWRNKIVGFERHSSLCESITI